MPKPENEKKIYSLDEISSSLERMIQQFYGEKLFWIRAEISEFRIAPSGHAYLNLIDANEEVVKAEMRAMIWKRSLEGIRVDLGDEFEPLLKAGAQIVFQAGVQFSKRYGISLNLIKIDLSSVLGDLEKKKQATIQRLRRDGLLDKNKEHKLPFVIQRIAVIGAPDSSGLKDFEKQLTNNEWGIDFRMTVIPVLVQGEKATGQITKALQQVDSDHFEAIALLRGGGSKIDLDTFNQDELCRAIAHAKLPVCTGIGHETDFSVADMVAHSFLKTPTALAYFFLERAGAFLNEIEQGRVTLSHLALQKVSSAREGLNRNIELIGHECLRRLQIDEPRELQRQQSELVHWSGLMLQRQFDHIQNLSLRLDVLSPESAMKNGYTLTRINNEWLRKGAVIIRGDLLLTETEELLIKSEVTEVTQKNNTV